MAGAAASEKSNRGRGFVEPRARERVAANSHHILLLVVWKLNSGTDTSAIPNKCLNTCGRLGAGLCSALQVYFENWNLKN